MNTAEALVPSRTAPSQGASRDTRVKDDGSAGAAQGSDDDSFRDVMSDLADRAEAKRGGAAGQAAGTEQRRGAGTQSRSAATQSGSGETGEAQTGDTVASDEAAFSPLQSGSLLAQVVLALVPVAGAPVNGEMPGDLPPVAVAGNGQVALKTSWQLLSSLANGGGDAEPQVSAAETGGAASAALAAISDGIEEAFANVAPSSGLARGDEAADDVPLPEITVTVAGEETHFAPVQSAESTLSRLLGGPAAGASGSPGGASDSTAPADGEDATGKNTGAVGLAAAETSKPVVGLGSGMDSRDGREGSGAEKRLPDGQASATSADQQGARSGAASAAGFQAVAASGSAASSADTSPSAQIARQITAELANPASRPATSTPGPDGAVKVLHLQLEPANLGSVTVRLALKDNVISVNVEASRHETAFAIEKDREALSNALKSAGYVVDGVSSQPADPARPSMQAQPVSNDGQMSSSLQSQSDSQSGLTQSGRRNQGDEARQSPDSPFAPASGVNESRGEGTRSSNGALYV
jgi:hypothetical protein